MLQVEDLDFEKMGGSVIAVIQNGNTGEVVGCGLMSAVTVLDVIHLAKTEATHPLLTYEGDWLEQFAAFETEILVDCDKDTLLFVVDVPKEMGKEYRMVKWFEGISIRSAGEYGGTDKPFIGVAIDSVTNEILMVGVTTEEAVRVSHQTRKACFWSRSREALWIKGETSGNFLTLVSSTTVLSQRTVTFRVRPQGPVCHTGAKTCFRELDGSMRMLSFS